MQNNPIYQFTSLSRPINPFVYPTHRLLVALVPIAGFILGMVTCPFLFRCCGYTFIYHHYTTCHSYPETPHT